MQADLAHHQSVHDYMITRDEAAGGTSTVFVIDSDASVRHSLERLIRSAGWESGSFTSAEEFLSQPLCSIPCCVIVDLMLPGVSALELQQQLAARPHMPMIFINGHNDVGTAALLHAIQAAIDRSRSALRHEAETRILGACYATLTPREREVMVWVASGLLNKQVGFELGISEATVKAHRGQVMRKMKAESLPHLVRMTTRLGLRPASKH